MFKQIQNYINFSIVCLILSNICFIQADSGCIDPNAYNCEDDIWIDGEDVPNYTFIIGAITYVNGCNYYLDDFLNIIETTANNCDDGPCEGYYDLLATEDDGSFCDYWQAPRGNDVEFTVEVDRIEFDWADWVSLLVPDNAVITAYHVQRCTEQCIFITESSGNPQNTPYSCWPDCPIQHTDPSIIDQFDWEPEAEIKYAINVQYSNAEAFGMAIGASYITPPCSALGDVNGDATFNVLDIVQLANCVLAGNCSDLRFSCAADLNGDNGYNVLDIVTLANCVLGQDCGGRIDDAMHSRLIMQDNMVSIEADGFIGGVQMTLQHGDDFFIKMTDRALFADYLTIGNETRLLVITPETDELFSYSGDFEITEIIVANTQYEVPVELPERNMVKNILDSSTMGIITEYSLSAAFPNPFNPITMITLAVPISGHVSVQVYNISGQVVATLANGHMDLNTYYALSWDATDAVSGLYFVKARADGFTKTQKLMLVK